MVFIWYRTSDNGEAELLTNVTAIAETITLKAGQGAAFPDGALTWIGTLTEFDGNGFSEENVTKREKVKVTNRSGDTLTVERGFWGDTATTFTSANGYIFLNVTSAIFDDIRTEIVRLESDKLNTNALRASLTANRIPYVNGSGGEVLLALWSNGQVLGMSGSSLAFITPTTDINGLVEVIAMDKANDFLVVYDASAGVNRKLKLSTLVPDATTSTPGIVPLASSSDITNRTAGKAITADQIDDFIGKSVYVDTNLDLSTFATHPNYHNHVITHNLGKALKKVMLINNAVFWVMPQGNEWYLDLELGIYRKVFAGSFSGGTDIATTYGTYTTGTQDLLCAYDSNGGNDSSHFAYLSSTTTQLTLWHYASQDPAGGTYTFTLICIA